MFLGGHHSQLSVRPALPAAPLPTGSIWVFPGAPTGRRGCPLVTCSDPGAPGPPQVAPSTGPAPPSVPVARRGRSAALTANATGPRGPSGQMTRVPRPPCGPPPAPGRPAGFLWGHAGVFCTCCLHCAPGSIFGSISPKTDESGKQQGLVELEVRPAGPGQLVAEASRLPGTAPSASQVVT